jgi:hypothetical protein
MALHSPTPARVLSLRPSPDDLTSWSEAAVCDRLRGFYFAVFSDADRARDAARLHWSCWRGHLGQADAQCGAAWQALARMIRDARFDAALIDRADEEVVDEVTDLVLHKYRRAPQQAKVYIDRLVLAAMRMARARAV